MEQSSSPVLLFTLVALAFISVFVALAIVSWRLERKRQDAIAALAARLGLSFSPDHDYDLARRHEDLRGLHEGENRYAYDVLSGNHLGQRLVAFDFHYETQSTDSKGRSQTDHHYRHVVLLHLEREFPNLLIGPEGVFSKIAQVFGYDDIDFESHEFSRRFCVRSPDKRFAYDFCNSAMIELLLENLSLHLEVRGGMLAFVFEDQMNPADIESKLNLACSVHQRMPAYLFAT